MSWWYVSTPHATCAVELNDDDIVVSTPPIWRRFVGRPAKEFGSWLRPQGDVTFKRIAHDNPYYLTHTYSWGNNEKRVTLKGRRCRIIVRGGMRSVMVEFENGQREIVSHRALRKENQ